MMGMQEDISFIKLVETNPLFMEFHIKKFQDRFNQFGIGGKLQQNSRTQVRRYNYM
jgi:hypothetical protein